MISFETRCSKRENVKKSEAAGIVADSMDVRADLVRRMNDGEITLEQAQEELRRIKRNAKKNGKITRSQAWTRG